MMARAFLWVLLAALLLAGRPAVAATYGLVVGIDDYQHLAKLKGAVNDARDIADALEQTGAEEVILLLDRAANRQAILTAWIRLLSKAKAGDTIVFSYAGHGGQEPEHWPGSEADGMDEAFLLAGFQEGTPGNGERIRDNEIGELFQAAPHLNIVFLADSCHSGTMIRSADSRAVRLGTRLGEYGSIVDDSLPPPSDVTEAFGEEDLAHVVFFGAVADQQLAPEFLIDGVPRGALSWAFARALRGRADSNDDKQLTTRELEAFLTASVRTATEGLQLPRMEPRGRPVEIAIALERPAEPSELPPGERPLKVALLGAEGPTSVVAELRDVVHEPDRAMAELIWDTESGTVISALGDVVAELRPGTNTSSFQAVADKWLLLRDLKILAEVRPIAMSLDPDSGLHHQGEVLRVAIDGQGRSRMVLFNLASDGTIQLIAPHPASRNPLYSGALPPDKAYELPLQVVPPYGADHLVALIGDRRPERLERVLQRLDQTQAADDLRALLPSLVADHAFRMGTIGLYTAP